MKYIIIVIIVITLIMFVSITSKASECEQSGGKYINTNEGGVCFDKDVIK